MNNIDEAYKDFKKFISEFDDLLTKDLSESDTRSKIIDSLLINILGWKEIDIEREGYAREGYFDYLLTLPGQKIIIEAKRNFKEFTLPSRHTLTSLNTLYNSNKDVIKQIRKYLSEVGTPLGIITNGKQYIISRFINTDGKDWKKNQALIFDGFQDIDERFIEFYNNLSRPNILDNGGFKFQLHDIDDTGQIVLSSISSRENEISRNVLSSQIITLINYIFGEIYTQSDTLDIEFIKECFIENKEIKKNRSEIERLFSDLPPQLEKVVKARNTNNIANQIEEEITKSEISIRDITPPNPIIIVGAKGAGKTTFINHLLKQRFNNSLIKNHPPVYIDFREYFNYEKSFEPEKISQEILDKIYKSNEKLELHSLKVLKRIYIDEIKKNDESIWKWYKENDDKVYQQKLSDYLSEKIEDKINHLLHLSIYMIKERRMRFTIVIDNADQFDMKIQESVFLFANSLNRKARCAVILSLREGYFYKWKDKPPFDAYESNVYHITAPQYGEVLQKRIDYTLKQLTIDGKTFGETKKGHKLEIDVQSIIEFLFGLKNSILGDENKKIVDFLNYSTYPNIREGLNLFKTFLISGYTNVEEYILRERFSKEKKVTVPIHEFIKAVGLNNKLYYNHEISSIKNIFYPTANSRNHFIKSRLLKYLSNKHKQGGRVGKFELFSDIVDVFVSAGYNSNIIQMELIELIKLELIDSEEHLSDTDITELDFRSINVSISPKGHYYINTLKNHFHYIELILQDTPIFNKKIYSSIKKYFPRADKNGNRPIDKRMKNVIDFMKYLQEEEENESAYIIKTYGDLTQEIFDNGLSMDIAKIEKYLAARKHLK